MKPIVISIALLLCSNVFMTFAWYAHLKELNGKPWIIAAVVSWGIALFEYLLQVPAPAIWAISPAAAESWWSRPMWWQVSTPWWTRCGP